VLPPFADEDKNVAKRNDQGVAAGKEEHKSPRVKVGI